MINIHVSVILYKSNKDFFSERLHSLVHIDLVKEKKS